MKPPPPLTVAEFDDVHADAARKLGHESMAWSEPASMLAGSWSHWVDCSCGYSTRTWLVADNLVTPDSPAEREWAQHVIDELKLRRPWTKVPPNYPHSKPNVERAL
jgi:hypothetical protein